MADWPLLNQGLSPDARMGTGAPAPGGGLSFGGSKGGVNSWGSTLGNIGSVAGLFAGPAGMAFGPMGNLAGSWIDASNANRGLASQGLSRGVSAVPAAISNGLFGLMGRMGMGSSIANQVGDIKNTAAMNDPRFGAVDFTGGTKWGGFGPLGPDTQGKAMDTQATKDATIDAWGGPGGIAGGSAGKSGDQLGADYSGGNYSGSMDKGSVDPGPSDPRYARGGVVRPPMHGAANPPGPDDQFAGLQTGEGVISRANMQSHPALAMLVQRLMQGGR